MSQRIRHFERLAIICLLTLPAAKAAAEPSMKGVWEGALGETKVRACFQDAHGTSLQGAYYDTRDFKIVHLEQDSAQASVFHESVDAKQPKQTWHLAISADDRAGGTRSSESRELPIHLSRVKTDEKDEYCVAAAFTQPRSTPTHVVSSADMFEGTPITNLKLDVGEQFDIEVSTFAVNRPGPEIARINNELRKTLSQDHADCDESTLAQMARGGYYSEQTTPEMITNRWLVTWTAVDEYCGGAHPNESATYQTWDVTAGREVKVWDWFSRTAVETKIEREDRTDTLRSALRQRLIDGWIKSRAKDTGGAEDSECADVARQNSEWQVYPTRHGLVFAPVLSHADQACGTDTTIPYAEVARWLNSAGKKAADSLLSDLRQGAEAK